MSDSRKLNNEVTQNERYELPLGWVWATVGDLVVDAQPGFASGKKGIEGGIRHLRMYNIGPDCRLDLSQVTTVPADLAKERHLLKPGDILFCHTNSQKLVGKTALFKIKDGPFAYSNHLTRLRVPPDGIPPQWLWYYLGTLWRDRYFETRCKQWVNQATVERRTLLSTPIPVAPLAEQRRIVVKTEALFEQSRTARQALDRIPPLLKKFRQSILASAFRGDLTRDWREQNLDVEAASALLERIQAERRRKWEEDLRAKNKDPRKVKYEGTMPVDTSDLPELPQGWVWVKFGSLISFVTSGSRGWAKYYSDTGPIFLRVGNLDHDSISLNLARVARVQPPDGVEGIRTKVEPGDILISITADVGMVGIIPEDIGDTYINQHVALARPHLGPSVSYLAYYLASQEGGQKQFTEMQYGMTKSGLNLANVKDVRIPFAPLSEQLHIVTKIQEMLTHAEAIEAAVVAAQRQGDKFNQSILARAFRGDLVPQDPNDEPVSILLDRTRGEQDGPTAKANIRAKVRHENTSTRRQ